MCISAALEGFFREEPSSPSKTPQTLEPPDSTWPPRDAPDSMAGLIDSRYIQNCCPLLEDLALSLVEAAERRRASHCFEATNGADGSRAADRRSRPIRKITPTAPPDQGKQGGLPADVLALLPPEDAELVRPRQRDPLKSKLEVGPHPHLCQRVEQCNMITVRALFLCLLRSRTKVELVWYYTTLNAIVIKLHIV